MQESNVILVVVVTAAVVMILLYLVISMIRTNRGKIGFVVATYCLITLAWMAGGGALAATIVYVGGTPGAGKVEHGHYFVGMHDRYTEVSPQFFRNLATAISWEERIGLGVATVAAIVILCLSLQRAWKIVSKDRERETRV